MPPALPAGPEQPDTAPVTDAPAEAARYAVLRRIGPALRHDLVVNLQAVALMAEVVTARLDRGLPPLADLQHHLSRIQRGTREAVVNSLRVATWRELGLGLILFPAVLLGNTLGNKAFGKVSDTAWRLFVGFVLGATALAALWRLLHA